MTPVSLVKVQVQVQGNGPRLGCNKYGAKTGCQDKVDTRPGVGVNLKVHGSKGS